ncbi:hypothetical protein KGF54_003719 [Candida jiufengensis]|uniref:uncharacterized protein n=1 Tax=Candida jiufengensis TaxID=497108 RepID=UPI00222545E2|nr:uncharacterized protein KGF54_003719 [Candida jiufengensis]KAI5952852.1 hypothetical protein KGF54_003719 [Candida jiufengensis]
MQDEINKLIKYKVFSIIDKPPNTKIITTRFVNTYKPYDIKGKFFKSRLVVQGHKMTAFEDYDPRNIYSPVIDLSSLRTLLLIAAKLNLKCHMLDVESAYLNSDIDKPVLVYPPKELKIEKNKVWMLHKSLYGLPTSSRNWYNELKSILTNIGLVQNEIDAGIFQIINAHETLIIGVYVDDLILLSKDEKTLKWFREELEKKLEIKYFEEITTYLGLTITNDEKEIRINQNAMVRELLKRENISENNISNLPSFVREEDEDEIISEENRLVLRIQNLKDQINDNKQFSFGNSKITDTEIKDLKIDKEKIDEIIQKLNDNKLSKEDTTRYQSIVGSMLWISRNSRPDISFSTNQLGSKCANPSQLDMLRARKALGYLYINPELELKFAKDKGEQDKHCQIEIFVDASYAPMSDKKSVTGYAIFVNQDLLSWSTKKQTKVTKSAFESELVALNSALTEAEFITKLLKSLGLTVGKIKVWEDNNAVISTCYQDNLGHKQRSIDIDLRIIQKKLDTGEIEINRIDSIDNIADTFTKQLGQLGFDKMKGALLNRKEYNFRVNVKSNND